jgi:hypothetical protein
VRNDVVEYLKVFGVFRLRTELEGQLF